MAHYINVSYVILFQVYRKYKVKPQTKRKHRDSTDDVEEAQFEVKRDLMCELAINIPKVRPNTFCILG